ncbi:pyocin knob domain-containing protein [Pseudoflavonifractor phocaeensis]|uniref:pyocin knob domain-containing protein n=1 Tax=Pseudoflavonifractor phocaeensis TaxID=1870988 RepID=UPI0019592D69|nr:pyocin knob domain-containing protein [Pseudoflavonifractor phocaeensis]MBM6886820.1 hypothetical protein [Pseudoflavonifractor phocaeensis]
MPNTVLGKVSLTPQGAYRSGTRYTALDLVGYEGGGYIALREVQDIAPSDDGVNWMLLAARGGEGIQGAQGIPGYVFTPSVSAEGVISWTNNGDLPNPDPIDITGPEGPRGPQGDSVVSIEHTGGTGAPGTTDTYTVKLSNGSIAGTFQVYNGADGNGAGDFKADGSVPMTGNLQMGGNRVVGVGSAQESTDAVNKSDLEKAIQSVTITTDAEPLKGSLNPVQSGGVFSALSNKVNQIITLGPEDDLNTITTSGFYRLNGVEINVPSGCGWGTLSATGDQNTALQIVSDHINKQFWKRTYRNSSIWSEWIPIPAATPPQEYSLPLAAEINPITPCNYRKNQFSEVFVGGSAGGLIEDGAVIATLPEGFRPKQTVERPATFAVSGAQAAGRVTIMPDGNISVHGQTSATGVVFSMDFVVAN